MTLAKQNIPDQHLLFASGPNFLSDKYGKYGNSPHKKKNHAYIIIKVGIMKFKVIIMTY